MKKICLMLLFFFAAFLLVGCGVSENYAEKVNEKAEADEHLTYEEVIDDLGEPQIDLAEGGSIVGVTGVCTWYKGCDSVEEAKEKAEDGKTVYSLTITFLNGKATKAIWDEYTPEE